MCVGVVAAPLKVLLTTPTCWPGHSLGGEVCLVQVVVVNPTDAADNTLTGFIVFGNNVKHTCWSLET